MLPNTQKVLCMEEDLGEHEGGLSLEAGLSTRETRVWGGHTSLRYYFAETSREKGLIERQTETVLESKGTKIVLSRDFLKL